MVFLIHYNLAATRGSTIGCLKTAKTPKFALLPKSLGVMVDEGLNWDDQVSKVKGKISGGLKSLKKKLKNLISQFQLDHVYRALIESHLRYANVIWGSLPKSKLNTLQRLQGSAHSIMESPD